MFTAINDDGVFQIGEDFVCTSFRAKGVATADQDHQAGGKIWYCDLTYSGTRPFLAIRYPYQGRDAIAFPIVTDRSGGGFTARIIVAAQGTGIPDRSFEWFLFDVPVQDDSSPFEVFGPHPDYELLFSANYPLIDVKGMAISSLNSLPSGRKYAFAMSGQLETAEQTEVFTDLSVHTFFNITAMGCYCTDTGVVQQNLIGSSGPSTAPWWPDSGLLGGGYLSPFTVVDVTAL